MESSFKKAYDKEVNSDGAVNISFKSQRYGAHAAGAMGFLFMITLLPASCAVTFPLVHYVGPGFMQAKFFSMITWAVLGMLLFIFLVKKIVTVTNTIKIVPKVGISFSDKNLPFSEVQEFGVMNETTSNLPAGTSYVYANTHGAQVKVTKYIPLHLAEAVLAEIQSHK